MDEKNMPEIKPCKCGRQPERDASLRGFKCSLSCMCGETQINFLSRSDRLLVCIDNWNSRITNAPFKHSVQELSDPDSDGIVIFPSMETMYDNDPDPLRRYVRARGGPCSGGGGPSRK